MLGVLLIAAVTAPALAWEFAMTGEMEWRFRYFARQGSSDLFGSTSVNATTLLPDQGALGLAGPVANTVLVQGFSSKNADARSNETRIWLFPEIRINPAIRLRGEYWVTGTNLRGLVDGLGTNGTGLPADNWTSNLGYNGWYFFGNSPGNGTTPQGMSVGLWEKFWATAQTPWGILAMGRRPFAFGLGWSTLHERDADTESIVIVAPYGPMTFILGPSTIFGSQGDNFVENSFGIAGTTALIAGPGVTASANLANPLGYPVGAGTAAAPNAAFTVNNNQSVNATIAAAGTDTGRMKDIHEAGAFTYRNGPVEGGIFFTYTKYGNTHFLPLLPLTAVGQAAGAGPGLRDNLNQGALQGAFYGTGVHATDGTTPLNGNLDFVLFVNYFKYFNGRFFFNAEYDFQYGDIVRNGGRPISVWADAWFLEGGGICGPAKLSVAGVYSSGHDRRGGWLDTTGATGQGNIGPTVASLAATTHPGVYSYDRFTQFIVFGGRQQSWLPYAWLIGIYGGGNNSFDGRGYWQATDLLAYAGRLDYAVAANLNVFGSYIYMNRASNTGTGVGTFRGGVSNAALRGNPAFSGGGSQIAPVPNVPDNYLGWEANVGVNWKLLEGLTLNTQFAYWQPGDWFKYAYVDYSNFNTVNISGLNYPINPNRGIDPLIGWQGSLVVDF
jgi:hypothetical protein